METISKDCPYFHVKKKTLLAIAGIVWLIAGVNVTRLGILSYEGLASIGFLHILLSAMVFAAFGTMFFKMSLKHQIRIRGYVKDTKPAWYFFDLKSYLIMAFMMSGGIWLRSSGLAPEVFIAVFYTGLGLALSLAGVFFLYMFFSYSD